MKKILAITWLIFVGLGCLPSSASPSLNPAISPTEIRDNGTEPNQDAAPTPTTVPTTSNFSPTPTTITATSAADSETEQAQNEPNNAATSSLTANLAAWYPFDSSADDMSGNENHGTLFGATFVEDRFGNPDSAVQFDGVDDYIEVAHQNSTLDLNFEASLSLWIYHQQQDIDRAFYTIAEKSDPERGGHSRYGLWLIDNHVEFCIQPVTTNFHLCLDSLAQLTPNEWHHIVGVHTGEALLIYLNGELDNMSQHNRVGVSTSTFEFFIGTDLYAPTPVFTRGIFDDLRVYQRPLTADDVKALYSTIN
ncbi:MAG: LamG domain-containing protein [Chloroflexota bacterium]